MEYLDVLNADGTPAGYKLPRPEVHAQSLWHAAAHIWFINSKKELLLQRRSPLKETGPNQWDVSCGGHIEAGTTPLEGALREIEEELGLKLNPDELVHIFTVSQGAERVGPDKNKEFNQVYLVTRDLDLSTLTLQETEVAEVRYMPWREVKQHIEAADPTYCDHTNEYQALFEYLETHA